MRRRTEGSITIFLCLVMTVMVALILGCIFSVKVRAGRAQLANGLDQALFSLLGGYDRKLLQDFDVFFLDGGCGTPALHPEKLGERVREDLTYVTNPSLGSWPFSPKSLFELSLDECGLTGYTLASDAGGRIFRDAALRYQKETAGIQAVSAAVGWLDSLDTLTSLEEQVTNSMLTAVTGGSFEAVETCAQDCMQSLQEQANAAAQAQAAAQAVGLAGASEAQAAAQAVGLAGASEAQAAAQAVGLAGASEATAAAMALAGDMPALPEGLEEAMPILNAIMKSPVLTLAITDVQKARWRSVRRGDLYNSREHPQGVGVIEIPSGGDDLDDRFLYNEYLLTHLGNCRNPQEKAALSCPSEYLIAGGLGDAGNLEGVINRILLMREGVNLMHVFTDPAKKSLVQLTGLALAVVIGQPELEETFSTALGAAWAYAESILDVRGLFLGKRNCFLKDAAHWQLDLHCIPLLFTPQADSLVKGAAVGPDYLDYLRMLLFFKWNDTTLQRSLDMVELVEKGTDRPDFRLDHCLANATVYVEALSERRVKLELERSLGYRDL